MPCRRSRAPAPACAVLVVSSIASLCEAFYLPGVAPIEYPDGAQVDLKVNKLTSTRTQLPYQYYVLPYCQPEKIIEASENLGEIMTGDSIENSPYEIQMNINVTCKKLCTVDLAPEQADKFRSMIEDEYLVNWIIDNMPAATRYVDGSRGDTTYMSGFPVGMEKKGRYFINNHVKLDLHYHQNKELYEGSRIVGFEVEPSSREKCQSSGGRSKPLNLDKQKKIEFTYDVSWTYSETRWASRWDSYLKMTGGQVHWFSILNSFIIMLLLSGMIAMILLRTLHRDITAYNDLSTKEEVEEETGWKLVHGDVFRKPAQAKLLSATVGCGVQVLAMCLVTLVFAGLGFLSPAHRGGLLQAMMLLFAIMAMLAGYVSSRFYKTFGGDDWKTLTIVTAFFYPGILFVTFFCLNLLIWEQKSSGAVPFSTMFALLVLWFGISTPLVFLGAYFALQKDAIDLPVRTNQIARVIPELPGYRSPMLISMVTGILPFGAVFTELFFIMSSIWQHQFYYLFGFLILTVLILIVTCAEIAIAATYFTLTSEQYKWQWGAFMASATSGIYVFLYSIMYFKSRLQIEKIIPTLMYFGYMGVFALLFFLMTGAIGFIASFFFLRAIYGSIKID